MRGRVHALPCAPALGAAGEVGISYHYSREEAYLIEMILTQCIYSLSSSLVSQLTPLQPQLTGRHLPFSPSASHSHPVTPWQPSYFTGFSRVVCSGIAWGTSGILRLWLALLQSQSNKVAPSFCRRVAALATLKPSPMTDLK